ncbi:6-phosphogluconolactonase [Paenibacillus sophorae]|uniref:6-phosphogluconolactonase n=1 Tax=Paenibacillus sophorae TaxID=1333845 RepID=A0A1H8PKM5_9BACL|nr:lactonase family protein [Paenibacillus sophorae]QWU16613.1 lactonase family protein [Paenibacillus sophorae]SEO42559.1 6-phosphogluconolactonase [Paenibacillus sophorae]
MKRPDEVLFYVGTYSPEEKPSIYLCGLNTGDGEMRIIQKTSGIENPSYITLNHAENVLYAVSEKEDGEVSAYSVDPGTNKLSLLGTRRTEGGAPCYVSISPKEDYVFVSNYSGGNVNAFPVNEDGSLGEMSSQVLHAGKGIREDRQEAPHPHSVIPDANDKRILVCDLGLDRIMLYRYEGGNLTRHGEVVLPDGSGPRHLAFHPSGKRLYCANELNCTVTVLEACEPSGNLEIRQHLSTLPEQYAAGSDDTAADIHTSPCGRFLYVSNRGHDSIALFHVDDETGLLKAMDWQSTGGRTPRNFAITGELLLAANQNSGNITSFTIDSENGRLIPTGNELEVPKPVCIAILN